MVAIGSKIQSQVQSELDKGQREYFLRQQLKAIQEELGEADEVQAEVNELREQLDAIELPEEVRKQVDRELARLERLQPAMAEYGVIRGYLEWIAALPWDKSTEDNLDLEHAREVLDEDHYDIEQVKDRILEFLAVRAAEAGRARLDPVLRRPARRRQDLARPLDRAGARAQSSSGSASAACATRPRSAATAAPTSARCPGVIIRALRDAGADNPLLMIDEIDKMGADFRGDPVERDARGARPRAERRPSATTTSTCRSTSRDVMFVTTANTLDTIPGPLRDRMEVIQLAGYTEEEKLQIAKRYLVPRQIERNGLTREPDRVHRPGAAGDHLRLHARGRACASSSARSARSAARSRGRWPRARAKRKVTITEPRVRELLGKRRFFSETRRRTARPGVATGLAWTPVGGEVLFIEATAMPGEGRLTITGQLGDVMQESAQAALSYVRSQRRRARARARPRTGSPTHDIHIHVPAGRDAEGRAERRRRDGDGAGLAAVRAPGPLRRGDDRRDHADRPGAADRRARRRRRWPPSATGSARVIAPALNEQDVDEIPEHLRKDLEFRFVSEIGEVLEVALQRRRAERRPAALSRTA